MKGKTPIQCHSCKKVLGYFCYTPRFKNQDSGKWLVSLDCPNPKCNDQIFFTPNPDVKGEE